MRILVKIQYPDGTIKTFDTALITIKEMDEINADGGVVVEYVNE